MNDFLQLEPAMQFLVVLGIGWFAFFVTGGIFTLISQAIDKCGSSNRSGNGSVAENRSPASQSSKSDT